MLGMGGLAQAQKEGNRNRGEGKGFLKSKIAKPTSILLQLQDHRKKEENKILADRVAVEMEEEKKKEAT